MTDDPFDPKNMALTEEDLAAWRAAERETWHRHRHRRHADRHDWQIPYETRVAVLERADDHCERCGRFVSDMAGDCFDLHHVNYDRRGDEQPDDLQALCRSCHDAVHGH